MQHSGPTPITMFHRFTCVCCLVSLCPKNQIHLYNLFSVNQGYGYSKSGLLWICFRSVSGSRDLEIKISLTQVVTHAYNTPYIAILIKKLSAGGYIPGGSTVWLSYMLIYKCHVRFSQVSHSTFIFCVTCPVDHVPLRWWPQTRWQHCMALINAFVQIPYTWGYMRYVVVLYNKWKR